MRFYTRKALQAGIFFVFLIFLNSLYITTVQPAQHSSKRSEAGQLNHLKLQNGDRTLRGENTSSSVGKWISDWSFVNWFRDPSLTEFSYERNSRSLKYDIEDGKLLRHGAKTFHKVGDSSADHNRPDSVHRRTELDDIFISVKTTKKYHTERLSVILDTWWLLARDQTYFFTDADDPVLQERTRGHAINTQCSSSHGRLDLCCKMSVEYDNFITSGKRWFCHVDDDTYLNVPLLLSRLRRYNHTQDWYLGKPSLNHPLEKQSIETKKQRILFWFATGGAGFCLSRAIALKMMPYTAGGKFQTVCKKIRLPDDCTIGFIVYYYLKKELTVIKEFHSHLEGLWAIRRGQLDKHLTFSYSMPYPGARPNVVNANLFNSTEDPTRFRSIHCLLYPTFDVCPKR